MISDKCHYCGKKIYLARQGRSYRWIENPQDLKSWGCSGHPLYVGMAHAPWEYVDAENRARKVSKNDPEQQGQPEAHETES